MNRLSSLATFALPVLAGLAAVVWVGAGYGSAYPLALAVTAVIGAFFLVGVVELWRYRQGTLSLMQAVDGLQTPPASTDDYQRAWQAIDQATLYGGGAAGYTDYPTLHSAGA